MPRKLEELKDDFSHIKAPNFLITNEIIKENAIDKIKPNRDVKDNLSISMTKIEEYRTILRE